MIGSFYKWLFKKNAYNRDSKLPDWLYLKMMYYCRTGDKLNLSDPKTINEKLQWLKLYNRNTAYVNVVDKIEVKKWVRTKCDIKTIDTIGVFNNVNDINIDDLPEQFVIKCSHDSGSVSICKDKSKYDFESEKERLQECMNTNLYDLGKEWVYKNVIPRLIIEPYMSELDEDLIDYKIWCFNGVPRIIQIDFDRFTNHKRKIYDVNWNELNVSIIYDRKSKKRFEKPTLLAEILKYAECLSKEIPFIRCDFYIINNEIYFGEMTFYPECGFGEIKPVEFALELGSYLSLPPKKHFEFNKAI